MNLKEYIAEAITTESVIPVVTTDVEYLTKVLKTMIAVGNLLDVIKKDTFYGLPKDPVKLEARLERLSANAVALNAGADGTAFAAAKLAVDALPLDKRDLTKINPRVAHAIIGLATESIELLEALLTAITNDTEIDGINVLEELGDLNWYHAIAVDALGGDWEQIQAVNIAKLRKRNKGTAFNAEATINRDTEAERKLLEQHLSQEPVDGDAHGF